MVAGLRIVLFFFSPSLSFLATAEGEQAERSPPASLLPSLPIPSSLSISLNFFFCSFCEENPIRRLKVGAEGRDPFPPLPPSPPPRPNSSCIAPSPTFHEPWQRSALLNDVLVAFQASKRCQRSVLAGTDLHLPRVYRGGNENEWDNLDLLCCGTTERTLLSLSQGHGNFPSAPSRALSPGGGDLSQLSLSSCPSAPGAGCPHAAPWHLRCGLGKSFVFLLLSVLQELLLGLQVKETRLQVSPFHPIPPGVAVPITSASGPGGILG